MSRPVTLRRAHRAAVALVLLLAFVALPAAAHAADLGTADPFVVLGSSTVTNTGASVLDGDLGLAPGTAIVGFDAAVVNGATHANDGVANDAQADLETAYGVAAGQAVPPANDLTGTNLGNRTLIPGAYRYTADALLTGPLTLDAGGDPDATFYFLITSALTTAPGSSVELINGASPCNVFWQVGSSATLDTTTAFKGNLMAYASIWLENAATVDGRLLALNGEVTLINNVLDNSMCTTDDTSPPPDDTPPADTPPSDTSPDTAPTGEAAAGGPPAPGVLPAGTLAGLALTPGVLAQTPEGTATIRRTARKRCTEGFRATVLGRHIAYVVFRLDGRRIAGQGRSPYRVFIRATPGAHRVTARVMFMNGARARTLSVRYRACAEALRRPRPGPSRFTG
jgi:hypothetical protein